MYHEKLHNHSRHIIYVLLLASPVFVLFLFSFLFVFFSGGVLFCSYTSTCSFKTIYHFYFSRLIHTFSKQVVLQVTIYIDVANFGARIDLLYGFVGNTYHLFREYTNQNE